MWMQTRHEIDPGTVERIKKGTGTAWQKKPEPHPMIRELCEFGRVSSTEGFYLEGEPGWRGNDTIDLENRTFEDR